LTSLEVGIFDKNTALTELYVDTKRKGPENGAQKGKLEDAGTRRGQGLAREVAKNGGGLAALKPCNFPTTVWE
jgi:hypothetical protein